MPDPLSAPSKRIDLAWTDAQGDRFLIERDEMVSHPEVIAGILVGSTDGEEAAVWVTRDQARDLCFWLWERLGDA